MTTEANWKAFILVMGEIQGGYGNHKDMFRRLASALDITLLEDKAGEYPAIDGYLIVEDYTGQAWRLDFSEDSYDGGQFSGYQKVTPKQKTITVWS